MVLLIITKNDLLVSMVLKGLLCFFSGVLTYTLYKNYYKNIILSKLFFTILEALLIFTIIMVVSYALEYRLLIANFIFCLAIFVFAFERGRVSYLFKHKIFIELGKISYSIYMTHAAVIFCFVALFMFLQRVFGVDFTILIKGERYLTTGNVIINNVLVVLILFIVIVISKFTYKNIERKWQKVGNNYSNRL